MQIHSTKEHHVNVRVHKKGQSNGHKMLLSGELTRTVMNNVRTFYNIIESCIIKKHDHCSILVKGKISCKLEITTTTCHVTFLFPPCYKMSLSLFILVRGHKPLA
jgi:hypothetical protein